MLTQAPLPGWFGLCRAFLHRPPSDDHLAAPWCRDGEVAGWLSRSAWSMALVALWRKNRAGTATAVVWLPDFLCNAPLAPLRQTGATLVFYPLTDQLEPDMAACRELAAAVPPSIFVLVHYFGRPIRAVAARDFCARNDAWLIEDATHVLKPLRDIGACGDFVLYSPHKHLPIPDGAVLIARADGAGRLCADGLAALGQPKTWPDQLSELRQQLRCSTRRDRIAAAVWVVKRVLQKFGVLERRLTMAFAEPLKLGTAQSAPLTAPSMSGLARRLLSGMRTDLALVARQRARHQLLWDALLLTDEGSVVATAERPEDREWTPYLAAYVTDAPTAEATYAQWQRQRLPVSTWPDLPPEVAADRSRHHNAWHLRHSRLYLPVHQSLSAHEMLDRCRKPTAVIEGEAGLRSIWNDVTEAQWHGWLEQAGRSNLMQSWPYGVAKLRHEGWRVSRGVFYRAHEPVALVQVLQKRVGGLLSVSRINRGPVFLRASAPHERRAVWAELARLGNLWRGRVLTAAPELDLSGPSLAMMIDLGFRQFSPRAWESAWLDLDLELAALRKKLDGKWRNMLSSSEKAGLELQIGNDAGLFDWMLLQYRELMQEKKFAGPSVGLLQALRHQLADASQLLVLRAVMEGEPVAGICLFRHGAAATYLLGWNGPKGRALKANQYLMWQAIMHLKQAGVRWFDLGGISEDHTPGVAAFKLGLNAERYELIGDYWKW